MVFTKLASCFQSTAASIRSSVSFRPNRPGRSTSTNDCLLVAPCMLDPPRCYGLLIVANQEEVMQRSPLGVERARVRVQTIGNGSKWNQTEPN